jgi:endonuclease/exonuclease/phosphatase family metal-dependent hydrolase
MNLRVLTLNLWGEKEPLEERMRVLERALASLRPDVIALQEVREIPGVLPNQAQTLASRLGYHWVWAPAVQKRRGGQQGLAILSRFEIQGHATSPLPTTAPNAEPRILLMAELETELGRLHCSSVHLSHRPESIDREPQVRVIDEFLRAHPSPLPSILMGDFNTTPDSNPIRFLRGEMALDGHQASYRDAYADCHPADPSGGITWARRNPFTARARHPDPERRIDYVFIGPGSRARCTLSSCRVVLDEPSPDGVFASDHFGVMADLELSLVEPAR